MTATAFLLVALTAVVAVADWISVSMGARIAEYVLKPLVMIGLLSVALTMDTSNDAARIAVVIALICSLAGDVFLMLPADMFVPGLASFLVCHVAYVVAMVALGLEFGWLVVGLVVVVVGIAAIGRRVVSAARATDRALAAPVTAYVGVISLMVVCAFGTARPLAIIGALSFYASDAVLGLTRFVRGFERDRIVVMVTYHVGQLLLVLSLL